MASTSGTSVTYTHNADGTDTLVVNVDTDGVQSSCTAEALGGTGSVDIVAVNADTATTSYDDLEIIINDADTGDTASYDAGNKQLTVTLDISDSHDQTSHLLAAIAGCSDFTDVYTLTVNTAGSVAADTYSDLTADGERAADGNLIVDAINDDATAPTYLTAANAGSDDGSGAVTLFTESAYYGSANTGSDYDKDNYLQFLGPDNSSDLTFTFAADEASQSLSIDVDGDTVTVNLATDANGNATTTAAELVTYINTNGDLDAKGISVSHAGTSDGSGTVLTGTLSFADIATDGLSMVGAADEDDDLGAVAMTFTSNGYGTNEFVSVVGSGTFETTDADDATSQRDTGADVNARINGILAVSDGLSTSINTSALDVSFTLDSDVAAGSTLNFQITEGGAPVPDGSRRGLEPAGPTRHPERQHLDARRRQRPVVPAPLRRRLLLGQRHGHRGRDRRGSDRLGHHASWAVGCVPENDPGDQHQRLERHPRSPDRRGKFDPRRRLRRRECQPDAGSNPRPVRHLRSRHRQPEPAKRPLAVAIA